MIIKRNLSEVAWELIHLNTDDTYVRDSAMKCIQKMVQIPRLWNEYFEKEDVFVLMKINSILHVVVIKIN